VVQIKTDVSESTGELQNTAKVGVLSHDFRLPPRSRRELRSSGLCEIIQEVRSSLLFSGVFCLTHSTQFITEDTPNSGIELISNILANDARWYGTRAARRWTLSEWLPNEGGIQNGRGWSERVFYLNHWHSFLQHMVPNVLTMTHCFFCLHLLYNQSITRLWVQLMQFNLKSYTI
jgi:hypothetical protein